MSVLEQVIGVICSVLHIESQGVSSVTPLLGAIPEFDSMAVVSIITAIEDRFGFTVDDDEIDASIFETVGSLASFVETKL